MAFDIENGFISKLIETKDIKTIKDQQIKPSFFTGENRRVFNYIQDIYTSTGEVPTSRAISHKFPSFKFEKNGEEVGTEESLLFWCGELRTKVKHNKLADLIQESANLINEEKSEEAYSEVKKKILSIEQEVTISTSIDITKVENRKEAYLKRKENKGIVGFKTGFPSLDYAIRGLCQEEYTVITAKLGVGKTWAETIIGAYCMMQDLKVLQFVTEMSTHNMLDRYEAILFKMTYGGFNYNDFKHGQLPSVIEEDYFDFLDNTLPHMTPLILRDATTVMGMQADIEAEKPDVVFIDGLYALADDRGAREDWARVTNISRDIKALNKKTGIPIVANTQLDIDSKGGLSGIKYSKAIAQDADNVIELYRDEIMIQDKEMKFKVTKNREGMPVNIITNWNFDCMDFSEIFCEGGAQDKSEKDEPVNSNIIGVD